MPSSLLVIHISLLVVPMVPCVLLRCIPIASTQTPHSCLGAYRGLQANVEGNVQSTHGPGEAMELEMCAAARLRNLQHLQLIDKDK